MSMQPLTHHQILDLIEPFARRERHVDLAASDRLARRLVFKPVDHPGLGPEAAGLSEIWELENPSEGLLRLSRRMVAAGGLTGVLRVEGADAAGLIARIERVPLDAQFRAGPGYVIAFDHRLAQDDAAAPLLLNEATLQLDGLTFVLKISTVKGYPAELYLTPAPGAVFDLPDDLLAVLGRDWDRLGLSRDGWRSTIKVRGAEPAHSRDAEAKFERMAAHVAQTLAEPPSAFHERMRKERWRVAMRRTVPLLACLALVAASLLVSRLDLEDDSWVRMLIFNIPPLLMAVFFLLREIPRIEIPSVPRPSTAKAWRRPPAA